MKDYEAVYAACLIVTKKGENKWVSNLNKVYAFPTNEEEQKLSDRLRKIIKATAKGLYEKWKKEEPKNDFWELLKISSIINCYEMLGESVPTELESRRVYLIEECKKTIKNSPES